MESYPWWTQERVLFGGVTLKLLNLYKGLAADLVKNGSSYLDVWNNLLLSHHLSHLFFFFAKDPTVIVQAVKLQICLIFFICPCLLKPFSSTMIYLRSEVISSFGMTQISGFILGAHLSFPLRKLTSIWQHKCILFSNGCRNVAININIKSSSGSTTVWSVKYNRVVKKKKYAFGWLLLYTMYFSTWSITSALVSSLLVCNTFAGQALLLSLLNKMIPLPLSNILEISFICLSSWNLLLPCVVFNLQYRDVGLS